jgi:FAD/FMN-containing dehydrogenase
MSSLIRWKLLTSVHLPTQVVPRNRLWTHTIRPLLTGDLMTTAPVHSGARVGDRHAQARDRLLRQYAEIPVGAPVRLAKRTSNLFRPREHNATPGLDVSGLDAVLSVDPVARTADVQAMTTYEKLVEATLPCGLMPSVVPQLKTITIGGAFSGLGIESSSFRMGLPHEAVREVEVLTGAGEIVVARPGAEHSDLFRALPNSYGTLGYALRLVIDLEPVRPYVRLRHVRFHDLEALTDTIGVIMADQVYGGERVDFLDGTVFSADEAYLTMGSWADSAPYTSDYTGSNIYYRSIQSRDVDYLTVRDYLWRWDTDWFWCSRAFGAQNPRVRRFWPKRWLRSDIYWKLIRLENRFHVTARLERRKGLPPRERVVQDVEIPLARTAEFLAWFLKEVPIEPVWLCPIQLRDTGATKVFAQDNEGVPWPLYPLRVGQPYVNVGFWSTVAITEGAQDGDVNRRIEAVVTEHDGHKSLYSDAYYGQDEFWALYGDADYHEVKRRYDPSARLLDLYAKAVKRR